MSERLRNVLHAMRIVTLGGLNRYTTGQLLKRKNCGVGTVSELQRLIERARSGEFDHRNVDPLDVPAALLDLIEAAIARLPDPDRIFLVRRVGAGGGRPLTLKRLGQQRDITRERARVILKRVLEMVRITFGPRIPGLLDLVKRRCLSNVCPLTPGLLKQWAPQFHTRLRLSAQTHARILGALTDEIPLWLEGHDPWTHVYEDVRDLSVDVARVVRKAGGQLSISEVYRRLHTQRRYHRLTVHKFLRLLRTARRIRIHFDTPQRPLIRLPAPGKKTQMSDGKKQVSPNQQGERTARLIPYVKRRRSRTSRASISTSNVI